MSFAMQPNWIVGPSEPTGRVVRWRPLALWVARRRTGCRSSSVVQPRPQSFHRARVGSGVQIVSLERGVAGGIGRRVLRRGRNDQRATAGRLMSGSSLKGAMVSRVMYLARWTAHSSFCSSRIAPTRRTMASSLGKMPTTSVRRLISPLRRSMRVGRVQLGAVLAREGHVGEHVLLGLVHDGRRAWAPSAAAGRRPARHCALAASGVSWAKAVAMKAATTRRPLLPACASTLRMKWTRGLLKNRGWSELPVAVQATKQWCTSTRICGVLRLPRGAQVDTSPSRSAKGGREERRRAA